MLHRMQQAGKPPTVCCDNSRVHAELCGHEVNVACAQRCVECLDRLPRLSVRATGHRVYLLELRTSHVRAQVGWRGRSFGQQRTQPLQEC